MNNILAAKFEISVHLLEEAGTAYWKFHLIHRTDEPHQMLLTSRSFETKGALSDIDRVMALREIAQESLVQVANSPALKEALTT